MQNSEIGVIIDRFGMGCKGVTPLPMFSYHSVNSTVLLYHSVNFRILAVFCSDGASF